MSVDFSDLYDLAQLDTKKTDKFMCDLTVELGARVLSKAKKRTPVKTGYLRRNWHMSDVKMFNGDYTVEVSNPVEYAPYIEYGHRTHGGKGWTEGYFMVTTASSEVENNIDEIAKKKLIKFLKGLMND